MEELPLYSKCENLYNTGEANPLEVYIHNNEPAGRKQEEQFRSELVDLLN